jgi:benzoyl-CoA reductase subunit D
MIAAGIDVGLEYSKVVILNDGIVAARRSTVSGGGGRPQNITRIWRESLNDAGVEEADVERVVSTGKGKFDAGFASSNIVEAVALSNAARFLDPEATVVVDVGADEILAVTLLAEGGVKKAVNNQKCAAGLGLFLEYMARRLDMGVEEMGSLGSSHAATVNEACAAFAELDALTLLNKGVSPLEVAMAVIEAVSVRANAVLNDFVFPQKEHALLCGGVAKNHAFVRALKNRSGIDFVVSPDPEYVCAIGAALAAAER